MKPGSLATLLMQHWCGWIFGPPLLSSHGLLCQRPLRCIWDIWGCCTGEYKFTWAVRAELSAATCTQTQLITIVYRNAMKCVKSQLRSIELFLDQLRLRSRLRNRTSCQQHQAGTGCTNQRPSYMPCPACSLTMLDSLTACNQTSTFSVSKCRRTLWLSDMTLARSSRRTFGCLAVVEAANTLLPVTCLCSTVKWPSWSKGQGNVRKQSGTL